MEWSEEAVRSWDAITVAGTAAVPAVSGVSLGPTA